MVCDGDHVSYAGPAGRGPAVGDEGVALSVSGGVGHVMWRTGARRGQVDPVEADLLVRLAAPGLLDDALDLPPHKVAVREVYEAQGEAGLLAALGEAGALSGIAQIAVEVVEVAAARVRSSLSPVLEQLDPEEADAVVGLATAACMREALGA